MFRWLVTILLLCTFAVQTFSQALLVAGYYANTESFAQACENKAKPVLKCRGKCQLMKKLQQEEGKNQQPENKGGIKNEVVSSRSFFAQAPTGTPNLHSAYNGYLQRRFPQARATDIFHPPLA